MNRFLRAFFFWVFLPAACAGAQEPVSSPPKPAASLPLTRIPRVQRSPELADFLAGRPREAELEVTDFRQYAPGDGAPVSEATSAYLSYDEKNLYVVFVCRDQPGQVRGHLSKRDDTSQDDSVAVFLDTFQDGHRAYFFSANPVGVQTDAIYTEGQNYDTSFDTVWSSEGKITAEGYLVRFAIPFRSLRFSHAPEQTWGLALYRRIQRKSEQDYWPYVTQRLEGFTQQFASAGGLKDVSPGRNIQFIPYAQMGRNRFLDQSDPANPAVRNVFEHREGLDAKLVWKDALTFDFTVNPDFSQVESDDPQVTVNQRFEVFFPEKRPFFIENAGVFQTPVNLFFSRRIGDPQFGGRMTGKAGRWALGALAIDDRAPGRGQPPGSPLDTRAAAGVVRVAREFGRQSQIGALFTSRDFADSSNRVAALDARLKLNENWVLDLQAAHSRTRQNATRLCQLPDQHLEGSAYWSRLTHTGRHFLFSTTYDDKTPGFCTELGFVPRTDIRTFDTGANYFWRPRGRKVLSFGPLLEAILNWDHSGRLQDWQSLTAFEVDFPRQTVVTLNRGEAFEQFGNLGFRKHSTAVSIASQPYKWLAFSGRFVSGTGENFFPVAGLPPFLGTVKKASAGFTLRPQARLSFSQTYLYSRLGTREGSTPLPFAAGQSIFNNHILRAKLNYQFTREFSLRFIADYNATLPNSSLLDVQRNLGSFAGGPVPPRKKLRGDILFTWLLNPGTAVYIGYTDAYGDLRVDSQLVPPVGYRSSPLTSTGRLFFVKLSYLFRY